MATEPAMTPALSATATRPRSGRRPAVPGLDRLTVVLFSLAAFLVVLALLAGQLRGAASHRASRPVLVVRKIYRTTVVETLDGGSGPAGTSVSQSVSSSGAGNSSVTAPATRSSG
jgi:hypothetical protein